MIQYTTHNEITLAVHNLLKDLQVFFSQNSIEKFTGHSLNKIKKQLSSEKYEFKIYMGYLDIYIFDVGNGSYFANEGEARKFHLVQFGLSKMTSNKFPSFYENTYEGLKTENELKAIENISENDKEFLEDMDRFLCAKMKDIIAIQERLRTFKQRTKLPFKIVDMYPGIDGNMVSREHFSN